MFWLEHGNYTSLTRAEVEDPAFLTHITSAASINVLRRAIGMAQGMVTCYNVQSTTLALRENLYIHISQRMNEKDFCNPDFTFIPPAC